MKRFSPERGESNETAPNQLTLGPSLRKEDVHETNQGTSMHRESMKPLASHHFELIIIGRDFLFLFLFMELCRVTPHCS